MIDYDTIISDDILHMLAVAAAYHSPYSKRTGIYRDNNISADGINEGLYEWAVFDKAVPMLSNSVFLEFITQGVNLCRDLAYVFCVRHDLPMAENDMHPIFSVRKEIRKYCNEIINNYRNTFSCEEAVTMWHNCEELREISPYSYFAGGKVRHSMWMKDIDVEDTSVIFPFYRSALYMFLKQEGSDPEQRLRRFYSAIKHTPALEKIFSDHTADLIFRNYSVTSDILALSCAWQTDLPEVMYRVCRQANSWNIEIESDADMGTARLLDLL